MLTLKVEITGKTYGDLELAMEEANRRIAQENVMGFDSNDSGSFYFNITGEEEVEEDDDEVE